MIYIALLGAIIVGISLGLLGSGGSILTVPILAILLHRPEKVAVAESLAIVGLIAFAGAIPYGFRKEIDWQSVLFFGIPGMFGSLVGAMLSVYFVGAVQLLLFSLVMIFVSLNMCFDLLNREQIAKRVRSASFLIFEGFFVGTLTGLIGCGGGFLIVPSLFLFNHLSMTLAVGSSLVIISMNAMTGFTKHLMILNSLHLNVSWTIITLFAFFGIIGGFFGILIGKKISQIRLRKIFGISVFMMGVYLLTQQIEKL